MTGRSRTLFNARMSAWAITFTRPVPYDEALRLQKALLSARIAGRIPDTVLFLEHPSVITLGVRAPDEHVLLKPAELAKRKIALYRTSRGGDATWHGPGQLVMYPIIRLHAQEAEVHEYLRNLEEIALRTAADFGVKAFRRLGLTGAWTCSGKLAFIGIRLKRAVTFHGLSFNVRPDLAGFAAIRPCGLSGERVTSLKELLGAECPTMTQVRRSMARHFGEVCRRPLQFAGARQHPPEELERLVNRNLR
ncbi:MAG: lipoyl(octanoyl) transferase LipB [Lentisphaerae bacterium]|nr:lipoyl(octanoyl) transferase LipB [Lentisphaerota bacterium]